MRALLRYSQGLLSQTAQIGACDHYHSTDQRLCRWLLMSLDRLSSNELEISSELIAEMTGVQPERFAEAAGKLRDKGLIEYSHSHIVVLDRPGLEKRACECYAVVKGVFDRLLPRKTQSEFA
jgi:CRP-like cAMP-binding protein